MGEISLSHIVDGQLPNTKTTLYTVPASTVLLIKGLRLVNTHSADLVVNIYANFTGTSRRVIPKDQVISAGSMLFFAEELVLEAGDLLEGDAGTAAKVDYIVSGVLDNSVEAEITTEIPAP